MKRGYCCLSMANKRFRLKDEQLRGFAHMLHTLGYNVERFNGSQIIVAINGRTLMVAKTDEKEYRFRYEGTSVVWTFYSESLPFLIKSFYINRIIEHSQHQR